MESTVLLFFISLSSWSQAFAFLLHPPILATKHGSRKLEELRSTIIEGSSEEETIVDRSKLTQASKVFGLRNTDASELSSPYVIHRGRATDMIKRCVSIEGLTLSKGWTPQATRAFKIAIEAVVLSNPILSGKLIERKKSHWPWVRKEIHVVPHVYSPMNHTFCKVMQIPNDLLSPEVACEGDVATQELFDYISSTLAPFMLDNPDFTFQQIKNESPLFQAKLLDFGNGFAAYSIKMSHALGDGTTFFQLVNQISSYMNGNVPKPIHWNNPNKSSHEIYPDIFSQRDYHRSYGLPFGFGLAKNLRTLSKRRCKYLLLSKDKIAKVKNEMRRNESRTNNGNTILKDRNKVARERISTNDIAMSAICELNGSCDIFAFDRSIRGLKEGVHASDAGNFFVEIPFNKEAGADPVEIRKILLSDSGSFYNNNEVPLMPFLNGRVGRITSLATITHQMTFPGSELLCQFPSASFISELPLDVAVIFKFNPNYWGIMHNFRKTNHSDLMKRILV